jgi:type VI secretion system protein ImpF
MNAKPAGNPMLLFDRLTGELAVASDRSTPDAGDLEKSLASSLFRLFNVRNALGIEQYLDDAPNAMHYGLPDLMRLSPRSATDLHCLERILLRAIALYEPRLTQVRVQARPDPARPTAALVTIAAQATLNRQPQPVHFDLVLDGQCARLPASEPQP